MLNYELLKDINLDEYEFVDYSKIEIFDGVDDAELNKTFYKVITYKDDVINDGETVLFNIKKNKQNVSFFIKCNALKISKKEFYFKYDKYYKLYPLSFNKISDGNYKINFDYFHFFNESEEGVIYASNPFNFTGDTYLNELNVEYDTEKSLIIHSNDEELMNDLNKNLHYYQFKRVDFKFTLFDELTILKYRYNNLLSININQSFSSDLFKHDYVMNNFINEEKDKSINRIVDMEKNVYYPVISGGNETIFADEIIFNFHFRERNNEEWVSSDEKFWNGTINENGEIKLDENYTENYNYDVSFKSDLLTYLNFNDTDVRYQKNRLKKSFVRLLFYDSDNQTNQNLLYTSTIFLDSGKIFGKYCRHIEDYPYVSVYDYNKKDLNGIRVDREPLSPLTDDLNIYDIEEYRLSSRITVKDKFNNDSSSEGFYLYLFKENNEDFSEKEIFLKVEFNHAGYGRTIPFMYPVDEKNESLTYEEVLNLWKSYTDENGNVVGFDLNSYYKYSYIKLIYKYDKNSGKYVYFLKNENNKNTDIDNSKIIINLFEAKIGNLNG